VVKGIGFIRVSRSRRVEAGSFPRPDRVALANTPGVSVSGLDRALSASLRRGVAVHEPAKISLIRR
jgi:hypothetical protein